MTCKATMLGPTVYANCPLLNCLWFGKPLRAFRSNTSCPPQRNPVPLRSFMDFSELLKSDDYKVPISVYRTAT